MPLDLDEHTPQVEDPNADEVSYNIDTATWGEEDSWFDWNQDPWTYPYAVSNYSSWYQAFKAADFKSPYYYKSAFSSSSDSTNEAYRVQWRGLLAKDYRFGSSPPASVADLPIKSDKAITTKQWPTPWGFGIDSPMSNIFTVLPGYSSSGYAPGNKWPEVDTYYFYTNFANKFGKNLYKFSASDDWGMEVDTSKTGRPMPFVPLFASAVSPSDSIVYTRKDFKGTSELNSVFMTYPNYVPLSFNYQKIVVLPKVYCAKYDNTKDYGLEFAGPFTIPEYFDGVNWDPDTQTGTAPKKDTYPMITAVRIDQIYFGTTDGTAQNRRTYLSGGTFNAFLPDTLTLGGPPSARILKNGTYNVYSSKWGADDNADNWHPATGYVVDGGLISGMGQNYNNVKTFSISLNTNLTDLRKSYINETQSTGSSLPLFHQNGDYEIHCVQRHSNNGETPQNTMGMCALWKNPTKEKVMRDVAYLGFWFADDALTAERGFTGEDCNSSKMHIPLFDKDGLTTGKWLSGKDAAEADNAKWQDPFKSNSYNPDKTPPSPGPAPGPTPDPNPNPIYPSNPAFTLANKGSACYALVSNDINDIFGQIYGKEKNWWETLMDGLKFYGSDPMAAIISYRWYPFTFNPTNQATIRLGGIEVSPTLYPYFANVTETLHTDSFTFWAGLDKNFVNSRHTVARLYLPFYGFYNLPIQNLISEELEVEFHYNVPDDLGIWIISFGNVIYDFVECSCHIDIPLSAYDAKGAALNRALAAVNMAASFAGSVEKGLQAAAMATIGGSMAANSLESMRYEYGYGSVGSMVASEGAALGKAYDSDQLARVNHLKRGVPMAFGGGLGMASATGSLLGQWGSTIGQTTMKLNQLGINIPLHGAATPTTFLNLPMKPYVQIFRNVVIEDYKNKAQAYKLTVGHACDKWGKLSDMPSNSLLRTSGIAAMDTSGMTTDEVQELNTALQTGFFKQIE